MIVIYLKDDSYAINRDIYFVDDVVPVHKFRHLSREVHIQGWRSSKNVS
jgi:hypothetical protein